MAKKSKTVSNRENAQKSTGPKMKIGKSIVSKNALRHGIFAREVVITGSDGAENQQEFDALLQGLIAYYQPEETQEMLLVEKIAADNWRLKRLLRFENGLLYQKLYKFKQMMLDEHLSHSRSNSINPLEINYYKLTPKMKFFTSGDQISEADFNREFSRYVKISSDDDALKADERFIIFVLSELDIIKLNEETKPVALDHLNQCSAKTFTELKRDFLVVEKEILDEMRVLVSWKKCLDYEERVRQLPAEKETHKIIKYETHLERMITKNISLLLALQRNRLARNFKEIKTRLN